ncbi:uncharacterized protein [Temnothorax longispinosus]|uniref:uncharacterized protein n=1 Tax=Temnothorax longispinosus TaxID=300112 RepID=UPI003A9A244B
MKTATADELSRVHNAVISAVNAQESIGRPIDSHGMDLFNHLVVELFDPRTRLEWESSSGDSFEPPSHDTLTDFIAKRILTLNAANPKNTKPASEPSRSAKTYVAKRSEPSQCPLCNGEHSLMGCPDFKAKPASERKTVAETNKLCFNCLGNHLVAKCQSTRNCMTCNSRHHTMLHDAYSSEPPPAAEVSALSAVGRADDRRAILLATARVIIADRHGRPHEVRALIDQGSEVSIVSESLVHRLHLPRSRTRMSIFGIGGSQSGSTRGKVSMSLTSTTTGATLTAVAFVLPRLSLYQGSAITCNTSWPHLQGLPLADPRFAANDPVELLLGAEVCSTILEDGLRRGKPQTPIAQKTILGWILSGGCGATSLLGHRRSLQVHSAFVRLAPEERECERLSVCAHERTPAGRYVVRRPVSSPPKNHAETRTPVVDAIAVQTELCTAGGFPACRGAAGPENLLRPRTITKLTPEEEESERLSVRTLKRTSAGRYVVRRPVSSHPRNLAAPRKPVDDATAVHTEVREPCTAGGLPLHKWATNSEDSLVGIPQKYRLQHALELSTITWLTTLTRHARDLLSLSAAPLLRRSEARVTLHWATDHASRWKPFMTNQVSLIQRTRHEAQWRHIPGRDNPANCSPQGIAPSELIGNPLRWTGPRWLPEGRTWGPDESDEIPDAELPKRKLVVQSARRAPLGAQGRAAQVVGGLKLQARTTLIQRWKDWAFQQQYGRRVVEAVHPVFEEWVEGARYRSLAFHAVQVLTGHGCFGKYLHRIGKERTTRCHHCPEGAHTAQHMLEFCPALSEGAVRLLTRPAGPESVVIPVAKATEELESSREATVPTMRDPGVQQLGPVDEMGLPTDLGLLRGTVEMLEAELPDIPELEAGAPEASRVEAATRGEPAEENCGSSVMFESPEGSSGSEDDEAERRLK